MGVSRSAVIKWIEQGEIGAVSIDGRWYILWGSSSPQAEYIVVKDIAGGLKEDRGV